MVKSLLLIHSTDIREPPPCLHWRLITGQDKRGPCSCSSGPKILAAVQRPAEVRCLIFFLTELTSSEKKQWTVRGASLETGL